MFFCKHLFALCSLLDVQKNVLTPVKNGRSPFQFQSQGLPWSSSKARDWRSIFLCLSSSPSLASGGPILRQRKEPFFLAGKRRKGGLPPPLLRAQPRPGQAGPGRAVSSPEGQPILFPRSELAVTRLLALA